ncbi:MAG: GTPase ObgE [bacterium TMED264]|nr:GTPase ObgE [Candidatus Neomarinimicrobiota bacterium]OUX34239.1 MAG: GTPase ObgE [bacterium TMED264]|tara:strand:- start:470 stop:1447 length:978 start_codon:yes stop_codon:yes gene_type:complete
MKFIDQASLRIKAGDGGHGCIAFLREKFRPKGGPCGGDGGKGGDVIFVGDDNLNTLLDISLRKHYKAKNGQHGLGKNMHGKNGENITISLPLGTIIKNSETKQVIVDITKNDEKYVILKGGNGGFGNARYKTKVQTAPRIANDGQIGQELEIDLELKVLADVGLVGFPNAGKSTFISKVSNAKPKIADYPFTTLTPNLGIVRYSDFKSFVIADIPGLIEDASKGKGLGSQFLKHIERTSVLAFMLDPTQEDVHDQYEKLMKELISHSKDILEKKSIIIVTKKDVFQDKINLNKFPKNIPIHFISSVTGENSDKAILDISELIEEK